MALGIFDSGVGGLTVFRALSAAFPNLDMYYLGDTARVPYGNKSPETIIRYSLECAGYLAETYAVDAIIIACNTASSHAVEAVRDALNLPVIGVVQPGAEHALASTRNQKIGVIGTHATIKSNSYLNALEQLSGGAVATFQTPCPLFVPLVEEGEIDGDIPRLVIQKYLDPLMENGVDTLILGCTHYPVLKPVIQSLYPDIAVADSSTMIIRHLEKLGLNTQEQGVREICITDESKAFENLRTMLVGDIPTQKVTLNTCERKPSKIY